MDIYGVSSLILAIIATIALAWPVNILLAALAYKVRLGNAPMPLEPTPFWLRSTFTGLGLAVLMGLLLGVGYLLTAWAEYPAGPVNLVLLMAFLPAGVWLVFWMYELEDMMQGLSVFTLFLLIPGIPLLLLAELFGKYLVLTRWLLPPS